MNLLRRVSSWKTFSILLVAYILFAVFIMGGMMSGGETKLQPLDLLFSYSPDKAYALITSYGDTRLRYAFMSLTADTAYPIIYTALFMVLIFQLSRTLWPNHPKRHRLALFPLFALVFDLFENQSIIKMLKAFPNRLDGVAIAASTFTSLKWLSVGCITAIIVVLVVLVIAKKLKKQLRT